MTKRKDNSQVGSGLPRPATSRRTSIPSLNSKFEAVVKDYEHQFKGEVLRWRLNKGENELIILFVDGRKFHFLLPVAWIKA